MNAASPVFRAQPGNEAVQSNSPEPSVSAPARTGSQDFAATLSNAGKPARKNAAYKHQEAAVSGNPLPASGNQPPLAPAPAPPPKTDASAAAVPTAAATGGAASIAGPASNAPPPAPPAVAGASSTPAKADDVPANLTVASIDAATPPVAAAPPGLAAALGAAPPPSPAVPPVAAGGVDIKTTPTSGPTTPHVANTRIVATPGTSSAAATNQGTVAAGNSAPAAANANAPSDSTLSSAATAPGATAQALMAAAAAQDASAPLPMSDNGVQQGDAMQSDPAPGAAAAAASLTAMAHAAAALTSAASTSTAASAATAAAIAQAVSVSTGAGAADKRSRSNGPDSTLSGAANDGSAGAAQLLTSNASTDSAPTPTFKIAAGVDSAQFGQGVADRVALMMDGNLTNAKLQVNPPALGPIEVRIALQGGHAQVWLSSHSALTRDALESSSSKLREMLGSQGFSQVSVDISQRSFQERSPQSQAYETAPAISADAPVLAQVTALPARSASALLDAYA